MLAQHEVRTHLSDIFVGSAALRLNCQKIEYQVHRKQLSKDTLR
jgi:hypothetical protein